MNLPDLLQLSSHHWHTATLHAAVKLDFFTHLADTPMSADHLATTIRADPRGIAMLLHALVAMDLLTKEGETFHCTESSRIWLSKNSDSYMGHIIMHHYNLVTGWHRLDEAVMTGAPVRSRLSHDAADKERENFLMGMYNLASLIAPRLASQINLTGRKRLLDLAGGPGTYAIHFCRQNPEMSAVVFDLPTTGPFAEQTIQKYGLSERISFVGGDITSEEPGNGYDVIWVSHLLHSESPEKSAGIIQKATGSLNSGGLLLIQEFILDDDKTAPLFPTLFSLNMLVGTPAGQAYSQSELAAIMSGAGLSNVSRLQLDLPNGAGVLAGTAP
jgi:hypothetical protein